MKEIRKSLLDIKSGIICHQVNCKGVMESGISKKIKEKYNKVYQEYLNDHINNNLKLGYVNIIKINDYLYVANLCGQNEYRRKKVNTNYTSLKICFYILKEYDKQIYFPYKMGCGLAGGKWSIVKNLIQNVLPDSIICKNW